MRLIFPDKLNLPGPGSYDPSAKHALSTPKGSNTTLNCTPARTNKPPVLKVSALSLHLMHVQIIKWTWPKL